MTLIARLRSFLSALLRRRRLEAEMEQEWQGHLGAHVDTLVASGLSRAEAERQASMEFGDSLRWKEQGREARGLSWIQDLGADVRYAFRQIRRAPAFAAVAVITLSLGIGATTAVYSVVNTILLEPLPFPDSDRLVRVVENFTVAGAPGRVFQRGVDFREWRTRTKTLSDITAFAQIGQRSVRTNQGTVGLWGGTITSNTFTLLGTRVLLGRPFIPGDEQTPDVVVLSFDPWWRYFNADPAVVGTTIELRAGALQPPLPARLLTIVGVLPEGFEFPTGHLDFFIPLDPARRSGRATMMGYLKPGVSLAAAVDEANLIGIAISPPLPANAPALPGPRFEVLQVKDQIVRQLRPALRVLLASAGVVLLIVCANVANLLLARGTTRQREIAVRLAIGASRGRIARQILAECLVLATAGGMLGAALGAAGVSLVKQLDTIDAPGIFRLTLGSAILPRGHELVVDWSVLGVAFGVAAITSIVFGVLPAMHLSRTNQLHVGASRRWGGGRAEARLRAGLVVGQLAMATVLLVAAGLLSHSFVKLSTVDKGYDPSNVLAFQLLLPDQYSNVRKSEASQALLARFRELPNVRSAGFSRHGVLLGEELTIGTFVPPGRSLDEMSQVRPRVRSVSDGYLTAVGTGVLDGREFDERDNATALPVIVLNRSAARRYFGDANPVGRVLNWHVNKGRAQVEVIGVVEDIRQESPADEVYPEIFVNYRQFMFLLETWGEQQRQNEWAIGFGSFALRTTNDPESTVPLIREIVNAVDANIGIDGIVPMDRLVSSSMARQRFYAVMLGLFAVVAAVLAAIGIYGLLAYLVAQRRQEIGIRMALGAQRAQVLALVLHNGLMLTMIGIALGLVGAAAGARFLHGMLFGITPLDPTTFIAVSLTFAIIATLASYIPARRATKVDPVVALRCE